jgi:hypothetical protein
MPFQPATTPLLSLLGKNIAAEEATEILSKYPALRPEEGGRSADGRTSVSYLRSARDGLLIKVSAEGEVLAIFLMSDGKDGSSEFRGELPGRLNFAAEPQDAIRALGPPASRRAEATYGGHRVGELLRFDWPTHSLHIQFRPDHDGIDLITAMTAREVPGRSVRREGDHDPD